MNRTPALLLSLLLSCFCLRAQTSPLKTDQATKDKMTKDLERYILAEINKARANQQTDSLQIQDAIDSASSIQASYMAGHFKVTLNNSGKYATTGKRVAAVGGTRNAEEVVGSVSTFRNTTPITPQENARMIVEKWMKNKQERNILLNGTYVYAGITAKVDKDYKKAWVSVVVGSFNTFNTGAKKRKELKNPYSKKQYKLRPADDYSCKNCDKFRDYYGLYQGIYLEGNKIYLKYENLKAFKKLMHRPKDALAIDIVQREQYEKADYNIYDNNLVSKGILLKRIYAPSMYKKNRIKDKKVKAIDIYLGTVPKNIKGNYELNLLVVQNNRVCRVLTHSYLETGDQDSQTKLDMLLWPDSDAYFKPAFEPKSETNILTFKIPFEKNKYDYKPEDIQPFLSALQEPDFFIEGLYIYAYSSIEGDSAANAKLQKQRAESVINAVKQIQNKDIETSIVTNDSWDLFLLDMEGTKWEYLTQMKKRDAIKEISAKGLAPQMEEDLSHERFAQIVMDITYDISGDKEQKFSIFEYNKALAKGDMRQALKIQYYIEKCIRNNKYNEASCHNTMVMPKDAKYLSVMMNNVVYRYYRENKKVTEQDMIDLNYLSLLDPSNAYVNFNYLLCKVKTDTNYFQTAAIEEMQKKIDKLYTSKIPKKYVDALNIEFQFHVMDACDTVESMQPVIANCITRIKSFYNIKEASWQNALKLSYDLIRFHDFRFAVNVLDPFINQPKVDEQLLFAYISACAQLQDKVRSQNFVIAMQKAKAANPDRYCKLFGDPYLSFQVLDNPNVKKDYVNSSCSK
jgi:uncharacterized protein YkwD/outer membrane protein OmpA-like peptidoglycan-associated protein